MSTAGKWREVVDLSCFRGRRAAGFAAVVKGRLSEILRLAVSCWGLGDSFLRGVGTFGLIRLKSRTKGRRKRMKHMNTLIEILVKLGITKKDLDYHLIRVSMVIIYAFFGYQKWFNYEAQGLIPFISHGPLISWMYPVFGVRGACYFRGVSEWAFGLLLLVGFWNKKLSALGSIGSCFTFMATMTIIPFMPGLWEPSAGGFPAMTETGGFL